MHDTLRHFEFGDLREVEHLGQHEATDMKKMQQLPLQTNIYIYLFIDILTHFGNLLFLEMKITLHKSKKREIQQ